MVAIILAYKIILVKRLEPAVYLPWSPKLICEFCRAIIYMEASKNKELYLGILGIAIWETQIWVKMRLFGGRESVRGLYRQKSQVCQSCLARIMIDSVAESTTKKHLSFKGRVGVR